MDLEKFAQNLTHAFGNNTGTNPHYKGIPALLERIKVKEIYIQNQLNIETDENRRNKQKLSLAVLKSQRTKAEKILAS